MGGGQLEEQDRCWEARGRLPDSRPAPPCLYTLQATQLYSREQALRQELALLTAEQQAQLDKRQQQQQHQQQQQQCAQAGAVDWQELQHLLPGARLPTVRAGAGAETGSVAAGRSQQMTHLSSGPSNVAPWSRAALKTAGDSLSVTTLSGRHSSESSLRPGMDSLLSAGVPASLVAALAAHSREGSRTAVDSLAASLPRGSLPAGDSLSLLHGAAHSREGSLQWHDNLAGIAERHNSSIPLRRLSAALQLLQQQTASQVQSTSQASMLRPEQAPPRSPSLLRSQGGVTPRVVPQSPDGAVQASGWQTNPAARSLSSTRGSMSATLEERTGTAVGLRRLSYALQHVLAQQAAAQQRQAQRQGPSMGSASQQGSPRSPPGSPVPAFSGGPASARVTGSQLRAWPLPASPLPGSAAVQHQDLPLPRGLPANPHQQQRLVSPLPILLQQQRQQGSPGSQLSPGRQSSPNSPPNASIRPQQSQRSPRPQEHQQGSPAGPPQQRQQQRRPPKPWV